MDIHIVDLNNWLRIQLETAINGSSLLRFAFSAIQAMPGVVYVVSDGKGGNQRRKDLYPAYKEGRPKTGLDDFYRALDQFRDLLTLSKAMSIRVPGYEADDVIATIVKLAKAEGLKGHIHSTDMDLAIFGWPTNRRSALPCKPEEIRLYKTLVGDPRDNIPGLKRFGEKAWEDLSDMDKRILHAWFHRQTLEEDALDRVGKKLADRLREAESDLRLFWQIIGFYDVPISLIDKHSVQGSNQPHVANKVLAERLQ